MPPPAQNPAASPMIKTPPQAPPSKQTPQQPPPLAGFGPHDEGTRRRARYKVSPHVAKLLGWPQVKAFPQVKNAHAQVASPAPALVDGRNSREEEESSGAFRRVVATPGPQRVLARTASCPADMSPEGTERFENTCRLQELRRGELCLPWREAAALIKPQAPTKRPAATGASQAPRRCKLRPRGAPRDFTTL